MKCICSLNYQPIVKMFCNYMPVYLAVTYGCAILGRLCKRTVQVQYQCSNHAICKQSHYITPWWLDHAPFITTILEGHRFRLVIASWFRNQLESVTDPIEIIHFNITLCLWIGYYVLQVTRIMTMCVFLHNYFVQHIKMSIHVYSYIKFEMSWHGFLSHHLCCYLAESVGCREYWLWENSQKKEWIYFVFYCFVNPSIAPTFGTTDPILAGVFSKMYFSKWTLQSSRKLKMSHVQLQTDSPRSHHI